LLVTANNLCVGFGHYPFAGLLNDTQAEALTRGPEYNWFGYYDKLQVDPSGRYVLGMKVTFEMRSPEAKDEIKIGMINIHNN